MDNAVYRDQVKQVFKRLSAAIDAEDPDVLEGDSTGELYTIIALSSGAKVIVNTQSAVQQIWVAGQGRGIHFSRSDDGRWLDDKGLGLELYAWVRDCVRAASGVEIALTTE